MFHFKIFILILRKWRMKINFGWGNTTDIFRDNFVGQIGDVLKEVKR